MQHSENIDMLAAALAKAQGKMEGASKDGLNPHFKSRYATLAAVWDACRGPLSENNLAVVQTASTADEKVTITTTLMHASGQWVRDVLTISSGDGRPQAIGSVISYGRRYQLAAMVGIAPEDDDAEAAEKSQPKPEAPKQQPVIQARTPAPVRPTQKPVRWMDPVPPPDDKDKGAPF